MSGGALRKRFRRKQNATARWLLEVNVSKCSRMSARSGEESWHEGDLAENIDSGDDSAQGIAEEVQGVRHKIISSDCQASWLGEGSGLMVYEYDEESSLEGRDDDESEGGGQLLRDSDSDSEEEPNHESGTNNADEGHNVENEESVMARLLPDNDEQFENKPGTEHSLAEVNENEEKVEKEITLSPQPAAVGVMPHPEDSSEESIEEINLSSQSAVVGEITTSEDSIDESTDEVNLSPQPAAVGVLPHPEDSCEESNEEVNLYPQPAAVGVMPHPEDSSEESIEEINLSPQPAAVGEITSSEDFSEESTDEGNLYTQPATVGVMPHPEYSSEESNEEVNLSPQPAAVGVMPHPEDSSEESNEEIDLSSQPAAVGEVTTSEDSSEESTEEVNFYLQRAAVGVMPHPEDSSEESIEEINLSPQPSAVGEITSYEESSEESIEEINLSPQPAAVGEITPSEDSSEESIEEINLSPQPAAVGEITPSEDFSEESTEEVNLDPQPDPEDSHEEFLRDSSPRIDPEVVPPSDDSIVISTGESSSSLTAGKLERPPDDSREGLTEDKQSELFKRPTVGGPPPHEQFSEESEDEDWQNSHHKPGIFSEWLAHFMSNRNSDINEEKELPPPAVLPYKEENKDAGGYEQRYSHVVPDLQINSDVLSYQQLVELNNTPLVTNAEIFQCPLCLAFQVIGSGVVLKECLHAFCRTCLIRAIESNLAAEIKCPFRNGDSGCEYLLQQREIKALLSPFEFEKFLARGLALVELQTGDAFHCQTPDCQGWWIGGDVRAYPCPICFRVNCFSCKAIHEDMDCATYKLLLSFSSESGTEQPELADREQLNYRQLMELDNGDLVLNTEPFECSICLTEQAMGEGVVLKDCLHVFCRPCLAQAVDLCEEAHVKCPYRDNNYGCESLLRQCEIKALVSPNVFEKHLARGLAQVEHQAGNAFHCKTPDCKGWAIIDENIANFVCPVCGHNNCVKCKAIHEGITCDDHLLRLNPNEATERNRLMLEDLLKNGQAMVCPQCKVIVQKVAGCDAIICTMCHTALCWATKGARWGPLGVGDTTGGCRCKVNGQRCHPQCTNCH